MRWLKLGGYGKSLGVGVGVGVVGLAAVLFVWVILVEVIHVLFCFSETPSVDRESVLFCGTLGE